MKNRKTIVRKGQYWQSKDNNAICFIAAKSKTHDFWITNRLSGSKESHKIGTNTLLKYWRLME